MAKRANQINSEKKRIDRKLEEFATYNDSLEEVLKKEQIEVSKFIKKLSKTTCFSCSRMVRW
jgi:SMC interacting uncharacterized protein involved in chromosome segregation